VLNYFPENSLALIDSGKPEESIEKIRKVLQRDLTWENNAALIDAKKRILYDYNIFSVLEKLYSKINIPHIESKISNTVEHLFSDHEIKNQKLSRRLKRFIKTLVF
jgi:uncharacterized protein YeeX (DUF496 family)